jgi:predicted acetyltransferase
VTEFPTLRAIEPAEFPAFWRSLIETFGNDPRDSERESEQKVFEFDRSVAGFDGDQIVSTSGIYSRKVTVPGGELPFAAVTMVTVAPTHRRRGVLTEMMRKMLDDARERQEPLAGLWASETTIYGRFGYGLASRNASVSAAKKPLVVRPGIGEPGRMRRVAPDEARADMARIYEAAKVDQVGWLDRQERWWEVMFDDPEDARDGATAMRYAVHTGDDGPDGYVSYKINNPNDDDHERKVRIRDLFAANVEAYAAVWRFVLDIDLVGRVGKWHMPADDAIQQLVTDPRALGLTVGDGLWVRLVDVAAALAGRCYATDIDVVLDVTDAFCPWNSGRYRLSGGPKGADCSRTPDAADLAISATDLAAAFLGGIRLTEIAAAGRVTESRAGALIAASRAFTADRAPWCPDGF